MISVLLVIIIAILLIAIFSCSSDSKEGASETAAPPLTLIPEQNAETASPALADTQDPYDPDAEDVENTPDGNIPSITNTPTPTTAAGSTAASLPSSVMTTPSADMINSAVGASLSKADVNLRQGPGTEYSILKEGLKKDTKLTVYKEVSGWYFLKVNALNIYGYIRKDMVKLDAAIGTGATAEPNAPEGTVKGTLNSTVVLRSAPDQEDTSKIKQFEKGTLVYIEYKEGDFYYLQVASTGDKGYMKADLIKASGTVPAKSN